MMYRPHALVLILGLLLPGTLHAQSAATSAPAPAIVPASEIAPTPASEIAPAPASAPATAPTPAPATAPASRPANGYSHVTTRPGGQLILNFDNASIASVLDELSAAAGFIVVKEVKPEGRVSLTSRQPIGPDEAISLLNTVLRNAGYAAIQQGRILKIVQKDAAKRQNIPVRSGADPLKIEPTDELITQVIPLRYADATQLKQDLQPLINPEADFTANASSNALVITDTSANVRRIVQIVAALDTHLADAAEVKVFQLLFAGAASTAQLINSVFANQDQFAGGPTPTGGGAAGAGGPGGGGPGGFSSRFRQMMQPQVQGRQGLKVNASADDRTNVVVVTGPADTLLLVDKIIKEVDSNPASEETVFVYRLKNGQSANVEAVLNMLFNGTAGTNRVSNASSLQSNRVGTSTGNNNRAGSSGSRTSGSRTIGGSSGAAGRTLGGSSGTSAFGAGGVGSANTANSGRFGSGGLAGFGGVSSSAARAAGELAGQVTIIADPDTNSLLVRTAPKNLQRVRDLLNDLDRPVAQVLIKVLIAEVTHTRNFDLGVEFSALNLRAGGLGQSAGTNFGLANATGGMVVSVLEDNFSATIRALEQTGKLDVLSRPYILASDNQLASITVGQEIPFITNSRITDTGQTINTVEYGDIGILLDVIPHINPDGLVILDVAPEISTLTADRVPISDNVSAPVIAKRSAKSRVGIRNGQTVVIGGLMEDRTTETINKVPFLGDIPGLGLLFRRTEKSKSKTELLIFLTPHVASEPTLLTPMARDETNGLKLVPGAVAPGVYQEHVTGLQRGRTAPGTVTWPATWPSTAPTTQGAP